jgi:hypothetical protein
MFPTNEAKSTAGTAVIGLKPIIRSSGVTENPYPIPKQESTTAGKKDKRIRNIIFWRL